MEIQNTIINKFVEIVGDENAKIINKSITDFLNTYCKNRNISTSMKNITYKNLYVSKARQLYHNLKTDSYINNKQIHKLLKNNKIKFNEISNYTYKQLYPQNWNKYKQDLDILNKDISDFDKEVQTTDAFTCPKCKKKKCVYYELQTRSSDEPMTIFITCLSCNHFFRQ